MHTTRRMFNALAGGLALSRLQGQIFDPAPNRLHAPGFGSPATPVAPGLHPLGLRTERDALLYVPESSAKFDQAPLVLSLHGASRDANRGIELLRTLADEHGFLLLAPATPGGTWDVISGPGGRDAEFINQSLAGTVALRKIDRARIAMAGFSDGASCSLALGLANGDFFRAVLGFSPGFGRSRVGVGNPPIFISHGTVDQVL